MSASKKQKVALVIGLFVTATGVSLPSVGVGTLQLWLETPEAQQQIDEGTCEYVQQLIAAGELMECD